MRFILSSIGQALWVGGGFPSDRRLGLDPE
jgi:hypothetical protein